MVPSLSFGKQSKKFFFNWNIREKGDTSIKDNGELLSLIFWKLSVLNISFAWDVSEKRNTNKPKHLRDLWLLMADFGESEHSLRHCWDVFWNSDTSQQCQTVLRIAIAIKIHMKPSLYFWETSLAKLRLKSNKWELCEQWTHATNKCNKLFLFK